jgi:hypothetical protein
MVLVKRKIICEKCYLELNLKKIKRLKRLKRLKR